MEADDLGCSRIGNVNYYTVDLKILDVIGLRWTSHRLTPSPPNVRALSDAPVSPVAAEKAVTAAVFPLCRVTTAPGRRRH